MPSRAVALQQLLSMSTSAFLASPAVSYVSVLPQSDLLDPRRTKLQEYARLWPVFLYLGFVVCEIRI
jgi:hypothetical protein